MGVVLSYVVEATEALLFTPKLRVVLLGLDGAGKTSLLYKLKLGTTVEAKPTTCFNVETFSYKNVEFTAYDLSGHRDQRPYWPCYFPECDAIIFVVDASDQSRVDEAAQELTKIVKHGDLRAAKLLVLANKQDMPDCMTVAELHKKLGLAAVTKMAHHIEESAITTGEGIHEALDWVMAASTTNDDAFSYIALENSKTRRAVS